ncbi:hypothetical protein, conserved [Eimeria maxima]|uniref:PPM-type phosphatase domain-containing protein n=1 Tax=Eimeria maxima TaxID=5804 RepID=U6M7U6_EIMMA|nr:hypothetical protein, conserved [Eimeria maxima]CDJ57750.1 hypothetical protein, conserved [Eimeria maxima]
MVPGRFWAGAPLQPRRSWVFLLLFVLAVRVLQGRTAEQNIHSFDETLGGHSGKSGRKQQEQHDAQHQQADFERQRQWEDPEMQQPELQEYQKEDPKLLHGKEDWQQRRQGWRLQGGVGVTLKSLAALKDTDSDLLTIATAQLKGLVETLDSNRKIEKQQHGVADTIQRALKSPKPPSTATTSSGSAGVSGAQGPANHLKRKTMKLHLGFAETAAATVIGRRADDEDALLLSAPLPGKPSSFITGLFDGHGGHVVARKCSVLTPTFFGRMPDFSGNSFAEASFALDAALRSDPEIPIGPGSTGIIGILVADDPAVPEFTLHVANIGDSRLLVLHSDGTFTPMSIDQKPNDPVEMARVQRAGGSVMRTAMGVWRIDGRLALSRSFGDFRMKGRTDLLPSQQKVVALPHARTIKVKAGDILVFACDGVFEAQGMTWKFVANFVAMQLQASGPK